MISDWTVGHHDEGVPVEGWHPQLHHLRQRLRSAQELLEETSVMISRNPIFRENSEILCRFTLFRVIFFTAFETFFTSIFRNFALKKAQKLAKKYNEKQNFFWILG